MLVLATSHPAKLLGGLTGLASLATLLALADLTRIELALAASSARKLALLALSADNLHTIDRTKTHLLRHCNNLLYVGITK
jgi:hypothetical protein